LLAVGILAESDNDEAISLMGHEITP